MKRLAWTAAVLVASVSSAFAMCPISMLFFQYGKGCSPVSGNAPNLSGIMDSLTQCGVFVNYDVPPVCCNVLLKSQWLVIGTQQINVPAPAGCSLLASPDILLALPPQVGNTKLAAALPMDTSLIGTSIWMQGITERFTTIGFTTDYEFSNGLEMRITP